MTLRFCWQSSGFCQSTELIRLTSGDICLQVDLARLQSDRVRLQADHICLESDHIRLTFGGFCQTAKLTVRLISGSVWSTADSIRSTDHFYQTKGGFCQSTKLAGQEKVR